MRQMISGTLFQLHYGLVECGATSDMHKPRTPLSHKSSFGLMMSTISTAA